MDIFDILGPVMVGPSSSHTAGAVRMGRMARTLLGEAPVQADIGLFGSFAQTGRGHGTDRAIVAGLLGLLPDDLRIPESFALAREMGLRFQFHPAALKMAHPNTAVISLQGRSGQCTCIQAASTGGGRIRVDQIDGVPVSFTGAFHTLVVQHQDVTGELSTLARRVTEAGLNIANVTLARRKRGGSVLTIIELDEKAADFVVEELGCVPWVDRVIFYEKEEG